ncbi:MAG: iron-containing alcohol dehydrogenase [Promethearchaeota archaeon]
MFFGEDALDQLEMIPGDKCFIVTDAMLVKLGIVSMLTKKLDEFGKVWQIFDEVEPDPHEETILRATEACSKFQPNLIIGIGGGSSLDAAKAVWFLYEHEEDKFTIDDLNPFEELHMGVKAKCVAIPTTSGTGAEVTWAVIVTRTDEDGNESKLEQPNGDVIPTYAIVDPQFTKNLPKVLTAATGFDIIAHSSEGLIAEWRSDFADACCYQALDLVKDYFVKAYQNGEDMEAREKMANAASLGGLGFGNSQVIIGHAMGHSLGAVFHLTHGKTVGVMLPYILQYCLRNPDEDTALKIIAKASKKLGLAEWKDELAAASDAYIQFLNSLQKSVDFPHTLEECGIKREDLDKNMERLVQLTNESSSITMSPREASDAQIQKLFEYAFEGKSIDF